MSGNGMIVRPNSGVVARQEFGAQQSQSLAELAPTQMAVHAQSSVQAQYIMAERRPRNWDTVRQRLLKACEVPAFADEAMYKKPIGKGITGLSIRFAEEAMQVMGNVLAEALILVDDEERTKVRFQVTDLESNAVHYRDVLIEKTVERRNTGKGLRVYGQRENSSGDVVYLVEATEDDMFNKVLAAESKHIRSLVLRLLPASLKAECESIIRRTLEKGATDSPEARRRAVIDGFGRLNIMPHNLEDYLGHELATATPAEIVELQQVWAALNAGEANWQDALAHRKELRGETAAPVKRGKGAEAIKDRIEQRKSQPAAPPPPKTEPAAPATESQPPKEEAPTNVQPPPPASPPASAAPSTPAAGGGRGKGKGKQTAAAGQGDLIPQSAPPRGPESPLTHVEKQEVEEIKNILETIFVNRDRLPSVRARIAALKETNPHKARLIEQLEDAESDIKAAQRDEDQVRDFDGAEG